MENAKEILQDGFPKSGLEKRETTKRIIPKRIIHFANGDTIDEYSTEEEDDEKEELKSTPTLDTTKLPWGPYLRFWAIRMTSATFSICDFLGGKLATLLGLDEPKYQYLLNEYYRTQNQENDKKAEDDSKAQSTEVSDEKQCLDIYGKQYGTNE
uniref:Protein FAM177B isoform X2 n=1 Tax=Phascolarctos cinereus TaxID=38626 RepID=A0A6P5JVM8_PHACI|nr:protein FAM177B isoform X2 [Phascolarctos cinereus]